MENINYYSFYIKDLPTKNILGVARHVLYTIKRNISHGNILIHCHHCVSRSPAVLIYYLVHTENISFRTALAKIKKQNLQVNLNAGFYTILYIDAELHLLDLNAKLIDLILKYLIP